MIGGWRYRYRKVAKRRRDGGRHTEIKSWRKGDMVGNKEKEKGGEEKARHREI